MSLFHAKAALRREVSFLKEKHPTLKPNFSQMARESGLNWRTVKKIWENPQEPRKKARTRKSKFDPYHEEIEEVFETHSATIKAVFMFFREKYSEAGVFTNYNSFKAYVRKHKLSRKEKSAVKPRVRYETGPGEELQVDWKESLQMVLETGEVIEYNLFTAVFGYSRYTVFIYSPTKTTEDFIRCLVEVLERAGGKPKVIKTDNMSAIVKVQSGRKIKLPVIRQFEKDLGVPIRLCAVRNPESKGKVESANRFVQWIETYQGKLKSEEELIETIEWLNREVNNEKSRTTGETRILRMKKEKEHLQPLNNTALLEGYLQEVDTQKVPPTLLVTYEGRGYSVPKEYLGKRVKVIRKDQDIQIYYNAKLIETHPVSTDPFNYKEKHYIEALKDSIKPAKEETGEEYDEMIRKKAQESLARMKDLKGKVK